MTHATGSSRSVASVLFNVPDHRVLNAVALPGGRRWVLIEHTAVEAGCPSCGTLCARVHQRTRQHRRDVPLAWPATDVEVVLVRRRLACVEARCRRRRTFVEVSNQVPLRARLRATVLDAVVGAGRVVVEVARARWALR